jgi:hypothetical protein
VNNDISFFHGGYPFLLVCFEMADYKTFSTKGFVDSIKSFWPHDHFLSKYPPFVRQGSESLDSSSALNNLDQQHNDGNDQQDMNNSTHRVTGHQSQSPQN